MKVRMYVKNKGADDSTAWEEEIDSETTGCLAGAPEGLCAGIYAEMVVEYFNATLKPGETPREVVRSEEIK